MSTSVSPRGLDFENPVFKSFCFYMTICIFKMLALGLLTMIRRIRGGVFANPEDSQRFMKDVDEDKRKPILNDPAVERARRNHQNDMEVIVPFILVGLFFCQATVPSYLVAINHFRVFTAARFLHTIFYQFKLQPFRVLAHVLSLLVILHMGVHVLVSTKDAM